jgi:hypothetical protein
MFENLIPDAYKLTKEASEVRKIGVENAKLVSLIVESIREAVSQGKNFVKIKTEYHNSVVEKIFTDRDKNYKIGPDFRDKDGNTYFTISWPED